MKIFNIIHIIIINSLQFLNKNLNKNNFITQNTNKININKPHFAKKANNLSKYMYLLIVGSLLINTSLANTQNTNSIENSNQSVRQIHNLPISVIQKIKDANITTDDISIKVVRLSDNQTIYTHHSQVWRQPASTQKLVTTLAGFELLGKDFVWTTFVYYTGVIANGILYGDIIIKGSGDPSLTYDRLNNLLSTLNQKIKHIKGNIYIDNSLFNGVYFDSNNFDGQGSRAYNASPASFLVNFGTVQIQFLPSGSYKTNAKQSIFYPQGQYASIRTYPSTLNASQSIAQSIDCRTPSVLVKEQTVNVLGVFGAGCGTRSIWRNLGDNDRLAILAVRQWQNYDKTFKGKILVSHLPIKTPLMPIVSTTSRPLSHQIWQINQFSNNVMTEQLALSLPIYALGQRQSDYFKALNVLTTYTKARTQSASQPVFSRASGLCRECRLTADELASLLTNAYHSPNFKTFLGSLPKAGKSGTMKRLTNHIASERAFIKTGTLQDTTAQAGYVQALDGTWYVTVGIINAPNAGYNPKAVAVLDELLAVVASGSL